MTDVVKIAKNCRVELAAEIAKLDDFIAMAERLVKYDPLGTDLALQSVGQIDAGAVPPVPPAAKGPGDEIGAKA